MAQLKWWLGVVSAVGLASACGSSSSGGSGTPAPPSGGGGSGGTGGVIRAAAGSTATGGMNAGGAGGASAGMSSGGASGGAAGVKCTPACTATQTCLPGPAATDPAQCRDNATEVTTVPACGYMALFLSKGVIYFTNSAAGKVQSVPVAGGTVTDIATGQKAPYAIVVDDAGVVYWSNTSDTTGTDNTLMMKAGGAVTKIIDVDQTGVQAGMTNAVKGLALDSTGKYLFYGVGDALMKVEAKTAGVSTKVSVFEGNPTALLLYPPAPAVTKRVYTTLNFDNAVQFHGPDGTASGCMDPTTRPRPPSGELPADAVKRVNASGCAFSESIGGLVMEALSQAGDQVLFIDNYSVEEASSTLALSANGSMRTTVTASADFDPLSGFTNTATTVYFGESTQGIISKATLPMGDPTILAQDKVKIVNPTSFVNDGTNMYFRTGAKPADACVIMKLPLGASGVSPI